MTRFSKFLSGGVNFETKAGAGASAARAAVRGKARAALGLALALSLGAVGAAHAQQDYTPQNMPDNIKAQWQIQGEYFGAIEGGGGNLGAWLIANGNDNYSVVFLPGGLLTIPVKHGEPNYGGWVTAGWSRSNSLGSAKLTGTAFAASTPNGYKTTAITGSGENRTLVGTTPSGAAFSLKRVVRVSVTHLRRPEASWGAAKMWFDSATAQADLSKWTNKDNGVQLSRTYYLYRGIQSKDTHGAGLLHIEFQGCFNPTATGQGRSNSGVYLQSHYEAQVLDSFGTGAAIDDYGAVYSVKAPSVNAALPPLTWHTYDIYFTPRTSGNAGDAAGAATLTIYANGVKTQDKTPAPNVTTAGVSGNLLAPGPLYLQNHGNEVVYNNIWFIPDVTEETLPYAKILDTAATALDYEIKPARNGKTLEMFGMQGEFDLTGRKIDRAQHPVSIQPVFSLPAQP